MKKDTALLFTAYANRKSIDNSPELVDQIVKELKPGEGILFEKKPGVMEIKIVKINE